MNANFSQRASLAASSFRRYGLSWGGILTITGGFLLWGRAWLPGLLLAVMAVILVFVLAGQPHAAFGVLFLAIALAVALARRERAGVKAGKPLV